MHILGYTQYSISEAHSTFHVLFVIDLLNVRNHVLLQSVGDSPRKPAGTHPARHEEGLCFTNRFPLGVSFLAMP